MGKVQNILTSMMQKVGSAVDKVAASTRSKSPKPRKTGLEDQEGHDFGYIQWSEKQIQSLLTAAERKELLPLVPVLNAKKSVHLTPGGENYLEMMIRRGPQLLLELDVRRMTAAEPARQAPAHLYLRGSVEHLPFAEDSLDFILYPSGLAWRGDLPALVPEAARCLRENGRLLLSIVHPFFEYLMNPKGGFKKNIETLFSTLKKNNFFIEDFKEGTLEGALRTVSLPQKMLQELQRFQGLPLILVMKGIRLRKKKA